MNFKSKTFNESEVMRSFAKIALEKGLVKASAKKEIDLKPTNDLGTNLLKLALGLRNKGLISQAELVESKIKAYLEASVSLQKTNIFQKVHPKGVDVFNSDLGKVETLDEIQDKFLALINKKASILDDAHPDGSVDLFDGNELGVVETLDDEHDKILKILNKRAAKNILNTVHPKGVQVFEGELGRVETLDEIQERFLKLIKKAQVSDVKNVSANLKNALNDFLKIPNEIINKSLELQNIGESHDFGDFKDIISYIKSINNICAELNKDTFSHVECINNLNTVNKYLEQLWANMPELYSGNEIDAFHIGNEPWFSTLDKPSIQKIRSLRLYINNLITSFPNEIGKLDKVIDYTIGFLKTDLNTPQTQPTEQRKVEAPSSDKKKNHPQLLAFYNELLSKKQAIVTAAKKGDLKNSEVKYYIDKVKETQSYLNNELTDVQVSSWIPSQKQELNKQLKDAGVSF